MAPYKKRTHTPSVFKRLLTVINIVTSDGNRLRVSGLPGPKRGAVWLGEGPGRPPEARKF